MEIFLLEVENIALRRPTIEDGIQLHQLIKESPPLDENSSYCNILQCTHFNNTSIAAESHGDLVGFISGYTIPERPDTLFIWQVAVAEQGRGKGLASRMLSSLLNRPHNKEIRFLETSITSANQASWSLFESLSKTLSAEFQSSDWMEKEKHFNGQHDTEILVRIGPFKPANQEQP